jgi:hypothetical protein
MALGVTNTIKKNSLRVSAHRVHHNPWQVVLSWLCACWELQEASENHGDSSEVRVNVTDML